MKIKQHILIVDDDHGIRDLLGKFLQQHGYDTAQAKSGEDMRTQLSCHDIDLIVLDIMLPGEDGMTLCREVRATSNIPIIMVTAIQEDVERILGLELGADDFLNKPFNPRELLARIKAILRRSTPDSNQQDVAIKHQAFKFANWVLDKSTRKLTSPDNMDISLSSGEYNLLLAFAEHPQQVLSRDFLLHLTKNRMAGPFDRSIDIQISRLRHKIEEAPKTPELIKTVRGGGYVLATTVERL